MTNSRGPSSQTARLWWSLNDSGGADTFQDADRTLVVESDSDDSDGQMDTDEETLQPSDQSASYMYRHISTDERDVVRNRFALVSHEDERKEPWIGKVPFFLTLTFCCCGDVFANWTRAKAKFVLCI